MEDTALLMEVIPADPPDEVIARSGPAAAARRPPPVFLVARDTLTIRTRRCP